MKKIITLSLSILLIYGCTTSSNGNGNSTTTVVPSTPSNLTGTVASATQISLSWTDNSNNETEFKIERKSDLASFAVIGTTTANVSTFNDTGLTQGTNYTYRVNAVNDVGISQAYSNEIILNTTSAINLPVLTTSAVASITSTTAVSGGNITNDGGMAITARGVCWSSSANPTVALSTKTSDGSGIGTFTSDIAGLSANTTYYVRAYATNNTGTAYGNELSFSTTTSSSSAFTDIDGNTYQTVEICNQTWTKSNLNVSKYSDGTIIPLVTDPTAWSNLTTGAWCYSCYDPNNPSAVQGKLYNWYAVSGIYDAASLSNPALRKKLTPTGWHVPTDVEWTTMINCLDPNANGTSNNIAGGKMKEIGTTHWQSPNTGATNSSGFTALPLGYLADDGTGCGYSYSCHWWSSSAYSANEAWACDLNYDVTSAGRMVYIKKYGYTVRCLKD